MVKDCPPAELLEAVRRTAAGLRTVDADLAAESALAGPNPLSPRETDVLRLAADGQGVAEIAGALFLSPGTVRNHLSSAIGKTGARTSAGAPAASTCTAPRSTGRVSASAVTSSTPTKPAAA